MLEIPILLPRQEPNDEGCHWEPIQVAEVAPLVGIWPLGHWA